MGTSLCEYNGSYWECESNVWECQDKKCRYSLKSIRRPHCMYLCDDMRCDNIQAHDIKKRNKQKC